MPADTTANAADDEDGGGAGPAPRTGPKTFHDAAMLDLNEQIARLKAQKALRALEAERDALDRELGAEKERETPEGRARARMEAQLERELAKRSTARADARDKQKEADERAEARRKQAKEDREAFALRLEKQIEKSRVGDLALPSPPDTFKPEAVRDFTGQPGLYQPSESDPVELEPAEDADFFALTEAQAQDLYVRIGADRAVVFDPTQDKVFHLGFRPVLRGPVTESALEDDLRERAGKLAAKLGLVEAEQTMLEFEIARRDPTDAGKEPGAVLDALLKEALARKERIAAALGMADATGKSRLELILDQRLRNLDAEDLAIPLPDARLAVSDATAAALAESARLRQALDGKLDMLERRKSGPARGLLLAYADSVRKKMAKVEGLELRIGARAEYEACTGFHRLVERKRLALEAALEEALKQEKVAADQAEAAGKPLDPVTRQAAADAIRDQLLELDRHWIGAKAVLREVDPKAAKEIVGIEALLELRAGVEASLEDPVGELAKELRTEIATLMEAWSDALQNLLPSATEKDEAKLDDRVVAALDALSADRSALAAALGAISGAPELDEVRGVRDGLGALQQEWRRSLDGGTVTAEAGQDPIVAAAEARAAVRRELQRQARAAADARDKQAGDEEGRLRIEHARAAAWCDELRDAMRLSAVADDRLALKRLEVDRARAALAGVQAALGKVLQARQNGETGSAPMPARIFFRKPDLDAKFENKFTASEIEAKALSSGIDTTDFRVNAAFTSAFVSGGAGWGRSTEDSRQSASASTSRRVFVTSSFLLPKVELSLPLEGPCASDEFLAAVRVAMADPADKAGRLFYVLREFGHFIPRRLTVGGRLYSTEERELQANESFSEVAKKQANEVQTSLSVTTPWFGGGMEAKGGWASGTLDNASQKSLQEAQSLIMNAVGGEGGYVKDFMRWAGSLQSYTRWQTIGMADLYPSIAVLPEADRKACIETLSAFVRQNSQTLASKRSARFLFYPGYAEMVGLRPTYFYLRTLADGKVLTLSKVYDNEGVYGVGVKPVYETGGQLWTISPEGYLISEVRRDGVELALTLKDDRKTVVAVPPDPANPSQVWQVPPRGPVTAHVPAAAGAETIRQVLRVNQEDAFVEAMGAGATLTAVHQWVIVSEDTMRRMSRQARVVYRSGGQVIELALDREGAWTAASLTGSLIGPKAVEDPFAYRTGFDGVPRVLYVDEAGDAQELWLPPERPWTRTPLNVLTGAPKVLVRGGESAAYVRVFAYSDDERRSGRVLYNDATGWLREIYLTPEGWKSDELTVGTVKIRGNPFGFVDGTGPRVFFRDPSKDIWELRLDGVWNRRNISDGLPGKQKAHSELHGYATAGGARVFFLGGSSTVREIHRTGTGAWQGGDQDVARLASGDPIGFVGADGKENVIFTDHSGHIQLVTLDGTWKQSDLTAATGAPDIRPDGRPLSLVTADRATRVLYRDAAGQIHQLLQRSAGARWEVADVAALADLKNWPADSDPAGYAM